MITAVLDIGGAHQRPSGNPRKACLQGYVARLSFIDESGRPITGLDPAFGETQKTDCRGGEAYVLLIRHPLILTSRRGLLRRAVAAAKNMGAGRLVVRQHQALRTPKLQDEYDLSRFDYAGEEMMPTPLGASAGSWGSGGPG